MNGVVCHEECEIADGFNMYFSTVAGHLADDISRSATSPLSFLTPLQNSLFLRPVTLDEIVNLINELKITSSNTNEISVKVIKLAKFYDYDFF